jgi:hypothetical protein
VPTEPVPTGSGDSKIADSGAGGTSPADKIGAADPLAGIFEIGPLEAEYGKWGKASYLTGSFKLKAKGKGEIVGKGSGQKTSLGVNTDLGVKAEQELGVQKAKELGSEGWKELFKSLKIKETKEIFKDQIDHKKIEIAVEFKVIFESSVPWLSPVASGKLVIAGFEWKKIKEDPNSFTVGGIEIAGGAEAKGKIPLKTESFDANLSFELSIGGSIKLNWPVIMQKMLEKYGEQALQKVAEEVGKKVAVITFDAIIGSGLILLAVGTIAASVNEVSKAIDLKNLINSVAFCRNSFLTGYAMALRFEGQPSNAWGAAGWRRGDKLIKQAVSEYWEKNKDAGDVLPPDEIENEATRVALRKAGPDHPQIVAAVNRMVGEAFWPRWVVENHGLGTSLGDARTACGVCYGKQGKVGDSDPDLKRWKDATDLPGFLT